GEEGEITINDKIEEFGFKPEIKGSKNQEVMDEYRKINQRFIDQRLDFVKKEVEARQAQDEVQLEQVEADYKKMIRRRYLFSTNFAIANADSEAAPYIALSELYDANIQLLDTINNSLTDKVKSSEYGKRLQKFVDDIKAKEEK
ncbi:MAG: thiol:disulfide interchange protein, partial [Tenacibaculum sp.]|nr:thiol:disulfide interchange protein [Tenacibaculum sp.]